MRGSAWCGKPALTLGGRLTNTVSVISVALIRRHRCAFRSGAGSVSGADATPRHNETESDNEPDKVCQRIGDVDFAAGREPLQQLENDRVANQAADQRPPARPCAGAQKSESHQGKHMPDLVEVALQGARPHDR